MVEPQRSGRPGRAGFGGHRESAGLLDPADNAGRFVLFDGDRAGHCDPGVLDVVVLAVSRGSDPPPLHAVYTGDAVDPAELAAVASERLPAYMRPAHYRHVDQLPISAHGKVDLRRLAAEAG